MMHWVDDRQGLRFDVKHVYACRGLIRLVPARTGRPVHLTDPTWKERDVSEMKLLTLDELAAVLGVPARNIYNWRSSGRPCPPAIKIGKHSRWREADVAAWLED